MLSAIQSRQLSQVRQAAFTDEDEYIIAAFLLETISYQDPPKTASIVRYLMSNESCLSPRIRLEVVGWQFLIDLAQNPNSSSIVTFRMIEELIQECFLEATKYLVIFELCLSQILRFIDIVAKAKEKRIHPKLVFRSENLEYLIGIGASNHIVRFFNYFTEASYEYPFLLEVCRYAYSIVRDSLLFPSVAGLYEEQFVADSRIYIQEKDTHAGVYYLAVSRCQSEEQLTAIIETAQDINFRLVYLPYLRSEKWARRLTLSILTPELQTEYTRLCALADEKTR